MEVDSNEMLINHCKERLEYEICNLIKIYTDFKNNNDLDNILSELDDSLTNLNILLENMMKLM